MGFGRLSDIINFVTNELKTVTSSNDELLDHETVNKYMVAIFNSVKNKYPEVTFKMIQDIFTRLFTNKMVIVDYDQVESMNIFKDGKKCFRNLDEKFNMNEVKTDLIKIPRMINHVDIIEYVFKIQRLLLLLLRLLLRLLRLRLQ